MLSLVSLRHPLRLSALSCTSDSRVLYVPVSQIVEDLPDESKLTAQKRVAQLRATYASLSDLYQRSKAEKTTNIPLA